MSNLTQHAHCSYCGTAFSAHASFPKKCSNCHRFTYLNPNPVAVVLQPVDKGLLLVRRGEKNGYGKLALPGGFIETGETWQEAAARELFEESNVVVHPHTFRVVDAVSVGNGSLLLMFVLGQALTSDSLKPFEPNEEALERCITQEAIPLAFPAHTHVMQQYFDGKYVLKEES